MEAMMTEQINRGRSLKKLIPHPLKYPELTRLAETCSRIIDSNIQDLRLLREELEKRDGNNIKDIFRGFRGCVRKIELVEYYGIPALYYQTDEIGYLNKLIYKIHQEINLPLNPPSVACISTSYYYYQFFTNVIFVPLGESDFLLHLPDFFHEIGHEVLSYIDELKLKSVRETYGQAINKIVKHYQELFTRKKRETCPEDIPRLIMHIYSQWKDYWIVEFFSDLFALYTLGPAYAWSHLHITSKKSENIYRFSSFFPQKHPSDDARMKMLEIGLNLLGFRDTAAEIKSKWKNMPFTTVAQPVPEYQYAYPEDLMKEVASLFLKGLQESNFSIASPEKVKMIGQDSIIKLLNEAWALFWKSPTTFREWEEKSIEKLKTLFGISQDLSRPVSFSNLRVKD